MANTFRGRKSNVTQNMMVVCSFNMLFTYVVTGWEGSVHDSKVLETLLDDPTLDFPHQPPGKSSQINKVCLVCAEINYRSN